MAEVSCNMFLGFAANFDLQEINLAFVVSTFCRVAKICINCSHKVSNFNLNYN